MVLIVYGTRQELGLPRPWRLAQSYLQEAR